ncbi:LysR substrate-binding domain-containing protein, partial [Rhizobium ruizarguesonis]
ANLLAPALAEFSLKYPKLRFTVTITSARQAVDAVNSAEADIAVTLFAPPMSGTKVRLRSEIVYDLITAPQHPAAGHAEIAVRQRQRIVGELPD